MNTHALVSRIYFLWLLSISAITSTTTEKNNKLILILLDGFKWNYFRPEHVGFQKIFDEGVKAEYLTSSFPSVSFPNYYSIATGLHTENHGQIENYMYDPVHNMTFWIGTQETDYSSIWWDEGEPIWITATKQGLKSSMYYWRGCQVDFQGTKADHCELYTAIPTLQNFSDAIDHTIQGLASGDIDFSGIYVELADAAGHKYGPDSPEIVEVTGQLDGEVGRLLSLLEATSSAEGKLADDVSVIIASDHGMKALDLDHQLNMSTVIDLADLSRYIVSGITTQLWPAEGKLEEIYTAFSELSTVTVYRKQEIPEEYHFRNHYRVPPLLLVAADGWVIISGVDGPSTYLGHHGYPPEEEDMRAIFTAWGPDFKVGHTHPSFQNVEIYQMMCHVMGLVASPNNGTWQNVADMLSDPSNDAYATSLSKFLMMTLFIVIKVVM